jgi:hypothetical protein
VSLRWQLIREVVGKIRCNPLSRWLLGPSKCRAPTCQMFDEASTKSMIEDERIQSSSPNGILLRPKALTAPGRRNMGDTSG